MPVPQHEQLSMRPPTKGAEQQNWFRINHANNRWKEILDEVFEFSVQTLEADSDLAAGDVVYPSSDGNVDLAIATSEAASDVIGIARAAVTSGQSGEIQTTGVVEITGWGLTAGALYFLSADTAGGMVTTPDAVAGEYIVPIGKALTATKLVLNPQVPGVLL